ncbi:MAG: Succinyl-CoA ligase (ADP-forming) subunit alpha [Syntrophorhabdaceae bacterium PtaU1.Bin034]|nr:MAG: Succinyl-CoA ligase (ADP-forming) subunit alpha [Syntrophorhabdaceae bacterium PtaU1.Bin034]
MSSLKRMFDPVTVAVIGATEREGSVGRTVLENLLLSKGRKVFPVNPSRETVLGVAAFKSVSEIPEPLDLAIIVTPAATVPDMVEQCGQAGTQGIVIISAGFRETGEEGQNLENRIEAIRHKYGVRIVGPNCLGFIRPGAVLNATFVSAMPESGKVAFISHSGALGSAILDWAMDARIGFSMFASLGSMLDVDFGDLIDYLGDDPQTKSIMIYMEGVGHARKFISAAKGFARTKPIIILKAGKFREGAKAALSHTGAMTGDDQVYDAAFKRVGVVRVEGIDDLFNCAAVLDSKHLPAGPRIAIVTNAGGPGAITTDWLIGLGGRLAKLSDESYNRLDSVLPKHWSHGNPIDVLGDSDIPRYVEAVTVCLGDPHVDGVLVIYTPQGLAEPGALAEALSAAAYQAPKPVITTFMGGKAVARAREIFLANNIPTYDTPEEAVKTYQYMYTYERNLELLYETPVELPVDLAPPKNSLKTLIRSICQEGRTTLTEEESKRFLTSYKIPSTPVRVARNVEEAMTLARRSGYPVALKIVSPDILHKTDVGGVVLGVSSDADMERKYADMMGKILERMPNARIIGVSVQKMVESIDYELILGAKKDKDFGAVILFGMGGVTAELFRDFSIALPPLNQTLARRLMEETKVYKMITGFRGKQPADLMQLEKIIVSFANLIVDFPEIDQMDINPIAISRGVPIALDARIIVDKDCLAYFPPYPHLVIAPYPTRYVTPYTLSDGTPLILRPIRPEDEPLEYEMLATLSPETVRGRFFQSIKNLSHEELTRFCNIDYEREMAFVAEWREGGIRKIVGVSRIIVESDLMSGEFAVLVHDAFQNKGLGYKLVDMLIGIAMEKRLGMIYGIVLSDNYRMLNICRKSGFKILPMAEGLTRVELTIT